MKKPVLCFCDILEHLKLGSLKFEKLNQTNSNHYQSWRVKTRNSGLQDRVQVGHQDPRREADGAPRLCGRLPGDLPGIEAPEEAQGSQGPEVKFRQKRAIWIVMDIVMEMEKVDNL